MFCVTDCDKICNWKRNTSVVISNTLYSFMWICLYNRTNSHIVRTALQSVTVIIYWRFFFFIFIIKYMTNRNRIQLTGHANKELSKYASYSNLLLTTNNFKQFSILTLILLTWRIWWAPNNASRWQMGINSAFKGLNRLIFQRQQYISISVHDSTICCSIIKGSTLAAGRAIRITKTSFVAPIWETKRAYVPLLHLLLIFIKFISRVLLPACNSYVC